MQILTGQSKDINYAANSLALSPDGKRLATGFIPASQIEDADSPLSRKVDEGDVMFVWDVATWKHLFSYQNQIGAYTLA